METRRRSASDDPLTITRRNTSVNGIEKSIPIDLIIEILSRLPARSVARCRCVSKLWSSILGRPDFRESFLSRSRTRPQLLFAYEKDGKVLFLSAPQPQNPDVNSSPLVCANRLMHFPINNYSSVISGPVHGLVCLINKKIIEGRRETVPVICNPSTGQSLTLPKVKTMSFCVGSYLGYDPIDKQFKVLSISSSRNGVSGEHQVLTIGGKNLSWRMIECCIPPHYSSNRVICINGVLYYLARVIESPRYSVVVCFDVRSEKFRFITIPEDFTRALNNKILLNYSGKLASKLEDNEILINYNGKLASTATCCVDGRDGRSGIFELWVLEDDEKQEWSKRTFVLPDMWQNKLGINYMYFLGMTRTNEIVFSVLYKRGMPICIFYYNMERNTITRVGIEEMEALKDTFLYKFLDHVEDYEAYASV